MRAHDFYSKHMTAVTLLDDETCWVPRTASTKILLTVAHGCTGDLMKSIYLLMYKAEENVIEMRARDFHSNYMTAVTILDDDTYLGAENSYNLFTVRKNSDVAADEDRNRLEVRQRSS